MSKIRPTARTAVALLLAHALIYRPWQLRWGATADEVAADLPGDDLIGDPTWRATRAVDIEAGPDAVWPWIAQMGAHPRAGWYSYDWIDNGRIPSATSIRTELQTLGVGDRLPMTAGSTSAFVVEAVDPGRTLVLASRQRGGIVTTTFVITPRGSHRSRLVHRVRFRVPATPSGIAFAASMDLGDFVMSRRTLLGIRNRAERLTRRRRGGPEPVDQARRTQLAFDLSVPVRRPASDVYTLLADVQDLEPIPRAAGVRMTKSPSGPTRVGTRWHEELRVAPGVWMPIESTVTEASPPHRLGMDFRTTWFTGHLDYEMEDSPDGTVLRQRETLRMRRPLGFLGARVDDQLRPRLLDRLAEVRDVIELQPS